MVDRLWNDKRSHVSALKLAKLLIEKDTSWETSSPVPDPGISSINESQNPDRNSLKEGGGVGPMAPQHFLPTQIPQMNTSCEMTRNGIEEFNAEIPQAGITLAPPPTPSPEKKTSPPNLLSSFTPLFIATRNGIKEIFEEILEISPQAVEHVSNQGMTIFHVAIQHRQLEIFRSVRNMEIPKAKLVRKRERHYNTILHCASNYNDRGTKPGPALQLQEELHWFEVRFSFRHFHKHLADTVSNLLHYLQRVRKIIPPQYITLENEEGKSAEDLFIKNHEELLKNAQKWLKETSQSCSAVAVLVATVVFAAAYTAPGGSDEAGRPVLRRSAFFFVFTITDIISLACSLTSVVMFLSVLTSPLRLNDFYSSLPRKLMLGFTLLFLSIATTMLTFTATILLTIHLKKSWTTTLIYAVAFLPVTVFALLQFPLYVAFVDTLKYARTLIRHILPWNFIRFLNPKHVSSVIKSKKIY